MRLGLRALQWFGCGIAVTVFSVACGDGAAGPSSALQHRPRASGFPRVDGTWDVQLESNGVVRGSGEAVHFACGGRLDMGSQRDSMFSGSMILRDSCAQFGGIDGLMDSAGVISRLTYTVTAGIGYCEIIDGDRHYYGTVSGGTINVRTAHTRRCDDEITEREVTISATLRPR